MAKVHFAPNCIVKYIGENPKEFTHSLARPRPILSKGDLVVVDKRTCFNLTVKGFGEFEEIKELSILDENIDTFEAFEQQKEELEKLRGEVKTLEELNISLLESLEALNAPQGETLPKDKSLTTKVLDAFKPTDKK